jgi:coenzyme F420-reducing hydrogenase gamma subunit
VLFPVKLLKRNAIDLSYWFDQQWHNPAARPPPKFEQVFDAIKQELTTWEPQMSSMGFLKELKLDGLGEATTPPMNVAPPASPYVVPKAPADDATASNPHFLEMIFGEYRKSTSVKTRAIRRKITDGILPTLPLSKVDQQPMCLAWHTKGQCNIRCPRAADHVAYTIGELGNLVAWCTTHYPKE